MFLEIFFYNSALKSKNKIICTKHLLNDNHFTSWGDCVHNVFGSMIEVLYNGDGSMISVTCKRSFTKKCPLAKCGRKRIVI